ncbi:MAG: shikimate dehydrogenase [Actinomycetota bacterium]|nr:shikimate dehydrogenase [Actinomycetota bacterium]
MLTPRWLPATYLGVCGWPVRHSRSPQMQNAALKATGRDDWRYLRLPLPPALFSDVVQSLATRGFRGVNVTIPHKEQALAVASSASPMARAIGAANTLTFGPDGEIHADNTDAPGLVSSLPSGFEPAGKTALVLGAGGAARAAIYALAQAGGEVLVWNRTPERARELASELGATAVHGQKRADIVVNCTSVGLYGDPDSFKALPLSADYVGAGSCVVDMVYRDGGTPLLQAARAWGAETVDGLEILVAQGAESFQRWTGEPAPRPVMRAALEMSDSQ